MKMERARNETEPSPEVVPLYHGGRIEVAPEDPTGRTIATHELNGCIATVIASEAEDGRRTVQLTHFPEFARQRQEQTVRELLTPAMRDATRKKVLVFAQEKRSVGVPDLERFFKELLGANVSVEVHFYEPESERPGNGTLTVHIPHDLNQAVAYETWQEHGVVEY